MSTSLKNGTASDVDSGLSPIHMKHGDRDAGDARISSSRRTLPEKPPVVDFVTFRKSS